MEIIIHWVLSALLILATAYLLPGVSLSGFAAALVVAVILGLLNALLKPLLIILTLPVNIVTLGLFTLVINGFLVWLASIIVPGFRFANFGYAILFALVLSLLSFITHRLFARYV